MRQRTHIRWGAVRAPLWEGMGSTAPVVSHRKRRTATSDDEDDDADEKDSGGDAR